MKESHLIVFLADTTGGGNSQLSELAEQLANEDITLEKIYLFKKNKISQISFNSLYRIYKAQNVNLIFSDPFVGLILSVLTTGKSKKIRFAQGDDFKLYRNNRNIPFLFRKIVSKVIQKDLLKKDYVLIANSNFVKNIYSKKGIETKKIIYPIVNRARNTTKPIITSIQAPNNTKNFDLYIQIFEKLKNDFEFTIISKEYFRAPKGMGILIPQNRNILIKYLSTSFAHISTSKLDSFGLPIYESMQLGIPSIIFNNGSIGINEPEYFDELLILEQNDLESLSSLLNRLQNDINFRKKIILNQNKVIERYSKENFIESISKNLELFSN